MASERTSDLDRYGGYPGIRAEATGFFRVQRVLGRWWFIDPDGNAFISLGVNHIESSALKYPDNVHIWRERYGSEERWLKEGVAARLRGWGFNTIGWTQEVVAPNAQHSPVWEVEQYQWAGMPYCHMLPFVNIATYEHHPLYPDVFGPQFEQWVDYVARSYCTDMADDPDLIGYFYVDCPAWLGHAHGPSWADGLDLTDDADLAKLQRIATRYYTLLHDAIRDTFEDVLRRLLDAGRDPERIMNSSGIFNVILWGSMAAAFLDAASSLNSSGQLGELGAFYDRKFEKAWNSLKLTYDNDGDGRIASDETLRSGPPVLIAGVRRWLR